MRKIILNLAVSLDGYIARLDGSVDWLDDLDTDGNDLGFSTFLSTCDTIIMGRKSYQETLQLGNNEWPFKDKNTYVYTLSRIANQESIQFVNEDLESHINTLKKEKGKNIWLFGGGVLIREMRKLNLVDEYIITTIPVFIGKGVRLFKETDIDQQLEIVSTNRVKNIVQTHYKVKQN